MGPPKQQQEEGQAGGSKSRESFPVVPGDGAVAKYGMVTLLHERCKVSILYPLYSDVRDGGCPCLLTDL